MRHVVAAALTVSAFLSLGTKTAEARTHSMACRGGGNMEITFFVDTRHDPPGRVAGVPIGELRTSFEIIVQFNKGRRRFSIREGEPPAGVCTFIDRGLRESEPNALRLSVDRANLTLSYKPADQTVTTRYLNAGPQQFVDLIESGALFLVEVENERGAFNVSSWTQLSDE
ncbi:MAG: hypothetical protein AAGJ73_06245 [Pseudomonadota bacterium]